jgi:hypothetical protein
MHNLYLRLIKNQRERIKLLELMLKEHQETYSLKRRKHARPARPVHRKGR